jgi:hypothetical protein
MARQSRRRQQQQQSRMSFHIKAAVVPGGWGSRAGRGGSSSINTVVGKLDLREGCRLEGRVLGGWAGEQDPAAADAAAAAAAAATAAK